MEDIFYLLKFSDGKIKTFNARNISISNNRFSSRIFDIYTVGDADMNGQHLSDVEISHTTFDFDDISIANNENLLNFGLLILFVGNPLSLPPDYVPNYEYYSVTIDRLNVQNSTFIKGQDTDLTDQLSVIQVSGAQVYIENSILEDSAFISFDFVSTYRELSSVFFVSSVVNNTNFTEANFMITRYEALMVTKGPFFNISSTNREVQAIYRYAFILDSIFANIRIKGGSLFTFRNAFLLMRKSSFDTITFIDSLLLNAGKFRPPGSDLSNITFVRNPKVEQESLERLNPVLPNLFDSVANSLRGLYEPTIYFYTLRGNNMTRLQIYSKSIINFEDYQSQQSFICVIRNVFSAFEIPDVATDIMKLSGAVQAFNFLQNNLDRLKGDGSVLRLSSLEENKFFEFNQNQIQDIIGPAIIVAQGTEIANMIISFNKVFDNSFSNTVFMLDMILHNGNIMFLENTFINNTLTVDDGDLNTMNSFIEVSSEASNAKALFVFQSCVFINNTYANLRTFNQYSQLNAMINLLLANSSFVLKDTQFLNTKMMNRGSDLFYVAAENVIVQNCAFEGTEIVDGQSLFNLLSWNIVFTSNRFLNTNIPLGKGLVYISPYPFLKEVVSLQILSNNFQNIQSQADSANVLFVENSQVILIAEENWFVDTFSSSPVFYFSNITFIDSSISDSVLHVTEDGVAQNLMYQTYSSRGDLNISDNIIQYDKEDDDPDILLTSQVSPSLNVIISNLTWGPGSIKNAMRLANVDSGSFLIMDMILEDFVYPVTNDAEGQLINVGSKSSGAFPLYLALKNVIFKNMHFVVPEQFEKNTIGLIGFVGSETRLVGSRFWMFRLINCSFLSIKNVAAVYVNMPISFDVIIDQSVFDSLYSRFGPAFDFFAQTNDRSKILIANSIFSNNKALKAGGAIYLTNSTYQIRDNVFASNSAGDIGGVMILQNRQRTDYMLLRENIFINNSATVGATIASMPNKILTSFIFQNGTSLQVNGPSLQNSFNQSVSIRNISRVALNISLTDNDDHFTLDTSNSAKRLAIITFADQPSITTFNCTKWGCYINSLNITLTGSFYQTKVVDVQFSSDTSKLNFQNHFSVTVSPCLEGEHFNPYTKTCDYCGYGTYSLTADETCQKCPENAYCPGGSVLMPLAGYWRSTSSNKTSPDMIPCRKDGVLRCNASLDMFGDFIESQCVPGYDGVKCEACAVEQGYVETGLLQCKKCSNVAMSFAVTLLSTIGFSLVKLYCINRLFKANQGLCSMVDSEVIRKENLESTYFVRLLLIYTQILSLIYLFHMEVRELVGSYTQLGNPTEFILYKLECSMKFLHIAPENYIYASVIYLFLSPVIQFFSVVIIAKLFLKKLFEHSTKHFLQLCIIYIILSEQPGIVGFMTGFFSCSQDDPSSSPYVGLHPTTKCDTPQYFIIRYFIVIPCLIFWAILIPILAFSAVHFKRDRLNQLSVRLPLGVLYNCYKPKYYWWGTVSMILAISLGFTTYFFQGDLKSCLALAFILLWIYQIAVRHAKPYKYDHWNKMEATTIGLLVLNLMLGYFTINSTVLELKIAAYIALAVINGAMVCFIVYKIVSQKVVTFVDTILGKLTKGSGRRRSRLSSKKKSMLGSFLGDDALSNRTESAESYSNSLPKSHGQSNTML